MTCPVIIGAGLAGLSVALSLAPRPVIVLGRPFARKETSSELAQGGVAACVGPDDAPDNHVTDTLVAGAGLCDAAMVRAIVGEGAQAIDRLLAWGVPFDRTADGSLRLGLEGAHSHRRIVHADGDATGAAIMAALSRLALQTPSIHFVEGALAEELLCDDYGVRGVVFRRLGDDRVWRISTRSIVLATGSACALWRETTVPVASWGQGLALAARAGAKMRDLEFVQFHPTALDVGFDPMPLVSEALRGEGARIVTQDGCGFVDSLAARDVVARAIEAQRRQGAQVFLDARKIADFAARFPSVWALCRAAGLNPSVDLLPIRPVAHYHMGGVATDKDGKTSVNGLWACGEVACTGLHGANRLASNSLLEAVVMGRRVAADLPEGTSLAETVLLEGGMGCTDESPAMVARVRGLISDGVGLIRDQKGLQSAVEELQALSPISSRAFVGWMIAQSALAREESRGAQARADFPVRDAAFAHPLFAAYDGHAFCVGE